MTLKNIDTVYKEFDNNYNLYILILKFNETGTKELLDFTMKYQGWRIALLIDTNVISVATITSPVSSGTMTLVGKFTEKEIDDLKILIDKEIVNIRQRENGSNFINQQRFQPDGIMPHLQEALFFGGN